MSKPFQLRYLFLFIGLTIVHFASGQSIKGIITDNEDSAIPYASVAVYKSSDSTLSTGGVTDFDGKFNIEVEPGDYYLLISFLSYEDKIVNALSISSMETRNVGKVMMSADAQALETVEVTAEKSQMELQLDKRVFNVGKDLSNAGSNASEILANVPSVSVDVEGNVSLRGSENVRILIDGKPSGLTGAGNSDALRMLQGNLIDKVEVITNPSSRYDAEGEVGIINIVLKKEQRQGINGAFEMNGGWPNNYGGSFSLNYRKKWINLFASNGTSYRASPGYGKSVNDFSSEDTSYYFESDRKQVRGGLSNVSRVGADIYFNEKNSLTTALLFKYSNGNNSASIDYFDHNTNSEIIKSTNRDEDENEIEYDLEGSVLYKKTFDREGREWTSLLSVTQNDDSENSELVQTINTGALESQSYQRSTNTEDERTYLVQTDYVHPIRKKGKIETGAKVTLREIENAYNVELMDTGPWVQLPAFSNELQYIENIYAGYFMFSNKYKRFTYQFGLRSEYSDIKTKLLRTNKSNPRSYLNFFPSAHLSYELNEVNSIQLSYTRRLSRPRFRELIPFFSYTDPRNYYSGNPDLNPEYTDSYEIGYLKKFGKGSILSSVYYRHTTAPTERITITDSNGLQRRFPINLDTKDAFGLESSLQYEFTKWWRTSTSINAYQEHVQGTYKGRLYRSEALTFTGRSMMNFKLQKDFNGQISGNYRAPRNNTQGKTLAVYTLDLGLSKDVLKGNGTITASAKDIFNSNKRRWVVDTDNLYSSSEFQWRARQFLITFTYRLNQKKKPARDGGSQMYDGGDDM
ncbi:MAG: TonB-dependent receptor [Flavobacteriales bacterium]